MRLGVLDIGSNTVHLLLVDAHPGARPVPFASHKRNLSLVAHLDEENRVTEQGQQELIAFVREAWDFAARHQAEDLLAFCTSAIREAENGDAVLRRITAETGAVLTELSGEQESAMTFLAVRRWQGWGAGTILNLDIGGGSFEMAMGVDELPQIARSVPLGAGRLTRDWLPDDPPRPQDVKDLRRHVRSTLKAVVAEFESYGEPHLVTATSKTFRSLARVAGAAASADGPFVRRVLRKKDLGLWTRRLAAMSSGERAALPGVSEIRARQLLAGALVADAAMHVFRVRSVDICPWALREGLILQRFDHLSPGLDRPEPVGVGHVDLSADAAQPEAATDGKAS